MTLPQTLTQPQTVAGLPPQVNDFSITVGTVNGSGSQTSNLTILRALFKMGVPVSGKNLFPSNIQGLPTWYTIRLSRHGFLARCEDSEVVVAMNPASFAQDLASVLPSGAFFYADDIKYTINRTDIALYPMPVKKLVMQSSAPTNLRDYVANMVYVGVVCQVLGIDLDAIHQALSFHFKGKPAPVDLNFSLIKAAAEWAAANLEKKDPYRVVPMEATQGYIMADGNTAAALGAIYGGVQLEAWYPITPASSLAESLMEYLPILRKDPQEAGKNTFAVIQAEDELSAIGMAVGAGWAGLRAMTSTSGPGFSLMAEYAGLAYFAETPIVVWDVQRVGPSTGLPTRTAQGDLLFAHFIGHGDTNMIVLLPGDANECFQFGWKAFDLAERLQTPIFVLSDLDLGMNQWMSRPFEYPDVPMDRGKVLWEADLERLKGQWCRYEDVDHDGIPYRTLPGNQHPAAAWFARGTGHDEHADYTEDPHVWHDLLDRLQRKYESSRTLVPAPVLEPMPRIGPMPVVMDAEPLPGDGPTPSAEIGLIAFGSTHDAIQEARHQLAQQGLQTDFLRIRAVPFSPQVSQFIAAHPRSYVVEMNRDGQLHQLLTLDNPQQAARLLSVAYTDGLPLTARFVREAILSQEAK